uniref:Uncharacterized protein n=1 Tax=Romanomermis culicivorax TaxID=13658 RepID=A0A915JYA2_ROMCU
MARCNSRFGQHMHLIGNRITLGPSVIWDVRPTAYTINESILCTTIRLLLNLTKFERRPTHMWVIVGRNVPNFNKFDEIIGGHRFETFEFVSGVLIVIAMIPIERNVGVFGGQSGDVVVTHSG